MSRRNRVTATPTQTTATPTMKDHPMRALATLRARREHGDADPVLVLVSVAVLAIVVAGVTLALLSSHRWSTSFSTDTTEQTAEDAARLAWLGDVGTSTAVVPAAKAGTTAETSVRFDDATPETGWPTGANCRAVTWWLQDTTAPASRPDSRDTSNQLLKLVNVHRDVAYYAASSAGKCTITTTPLAKAATSTPIRNAEPGAHFSYLNGHLRTLAFPNSATPGVEACSAVTKTDAAGLTACLTKAGYKTSDIPAGRSAWEFADPEPLQVLLDMDTDQVATDGDGYATQIGWRESTGRREQTGDPNSQNANTLHNPTNPNTPAGPPSVIKAEVTSPTDDPASDSVSITRTDTRVLDGFDWRCQEFLLGTAVRWIGPTAFSTANPPTAVTIPGTRPGYTYTCQQMGWVQATVTQSSPASTAGQRFSGGESPWSATVTQTRRPVAPAPAGVLNGNFTSTFTWPAVTGAAGYEAQYRVNATGTWQSLGTLTATSWTSAVLPPDTRMYFRARSVNDGGKSPWTTVYVDRVLTPPSVSIEGGAVGKSSYGTSWANVTGFDASLGHVYEVQYRPSAGSGWATVRQTSTSFTVNGVAVGETASVMVRAVGVNAGASAWSNTASVTRPVGTPNPPGINTGAYSGGVSSSPYGSVCESGTSVQYRFEEQMAGASSWQGSGWGVGSAQHGIGEGSTVNVRWIARCVANSGVVSGEAASGTSIYRPWTAPATPTMYGASDGYEGTNITFSWSASGGYYQVVNASYSQRAITGATSLTVGREAGSTCARVRAAKSAAAAAEGAWSGWSGLACGDTYTIPSAPGISSATYNLSAGINAQINTVRVTVGAVAGATSYEGRFRYFDSGLGTYSGWTSRAVSPGVATGLGGCITARGAISAVEIGARSGNSAGWSGWSDVNATRNAAGPGCQ